MRNLRALYLQIAIIMRKIYRPDYLFIYHKVVTFGFLDARVLFFLTIQFFICA